MSLVNNKKKVFDQISVLSSIGAKVEQPPDLNSVSTVNNKKETIPFLLDMLVKLKGSDAVQKATGNVLTKFVKKSEPQMKTSLKTQLTPFNSNQSLPSNFVTGYNIPVKSIDSFGKLKTNPDSTEGSLIYSDDTNNFDRAAYDAIRNPGTEVTNNNVTLKYNEISNTYTVKPINSSQTIGTFISGFITGMEIINLKQFNAEIINEIFGNINKQQKKTYEQIVEEQKTKKMINKLIDDEDDLEFSDADIKAIQAESEAIEKGVNIIDLGCGLFETSLSLEDTTDFIRSISGTTNPEKVSQGYSDIMDKSLNGNDLGKDKTTARDSFFKRIIKKIVELLVIAITSSPQIMLIKILFESFKNNGQLTVPASSEADIKNSKNQSKCLANEVKTEMNKFIYNLIKVELLKLVKQSSKVIIREKLSAFSDILKSLAF